MKKKLISIVSGCYNEENNVEELHHHVMEVMERFPQYDVELIIIDNASTDGTVAVLKRIAEQDRRVKIIVNNRNFGHIRSSYHAMLQARGDAVICIVSDLQDPPEMIADFLAKWEEGCKIVIGVKAKSKENPLMFAIRQFYYFLIHWASETKQVKGFTGFGLYDQCVIEHLREFAEPYPYMRGLIAEIGYNIYEIPYVQPLRKFGLTKNNFYSLYDLAMTGFVNYSRLPLRLATFTGFAVAAASMFVALFYLIYKLLYWNSFSIGMAPLVLGMFFFSAIQLIFLGIMGEYVGAILTQVKNRPHVIEKERINFDDDHHNPTMEEQR